MSHVDALELGHSHLALEVQANGHGEFYSAMIADLRSLLASLRTTLDGRATGEFPRLRRETPTDPEAQTPPRPVVERRRSRNTKQDRER